MVNSAFEIGLQSYSDIEELKEATYGSYKVVSFPKALFSICFVECIGITLYDPKTRILGLAHVGGSRSCIDEMIRGMKGLGASVERLQAKLNGETWKGKPGSGVKDLHSDSIKEELKEKKIPLVAEYLDKGIQDIIAHSATGKVEIYNRHLKETVFI